MIKLYDYQTEKAFPAEMRTTERRAVAYAFDRQKKKFIDYMQKVYIWADLDMVDDAKLDFLAVESRVLFYNSSLDPDVKRSLIRNSIYWYMKLGTRQAMEEMIDTVFGNENTSVEEWYTYAGEPFHFRIAVGTVVTQTSIQEFLSYLNKIKNARSRFDYLVFQNGITLTIYQLSEYRDFFYTFCGEFECGVYPNTEIGFHPADITVTLEGDSTAGIAEYEQAGTKPDISVGAVLPETVVDLRAAAEKDNFPYPNEERAGSYPEVSVGLALEDGDVSVEPEGAGTNFPYPQEEHSGIYPGIQTGAALADGTVTVEPGADSGKTAYQQAGTSPDISVGLALESGMVTAEPDGGETNFPYPHEENSGAYPVVSMGGASAGMEVDMGPEGGSGKAAYQQAGTGPDIAEGFAGSESGLDIQAVQGQNPIIYTESGISPDISVGAQSNDVSISMEGGSAGDAVAYPADGEAESGSYPDPAVGLAGAESGVSASVGNDGFDIYYSTDADKRAAEE